MCVCVCVCMRGECVFACVCRKRVCASLCMQLCMFSNAQLHLSMHAHAHVCAVTSIHSHMFITVCVCVCVCLCSCLKSQVTCLFKQYVCLHFDILSIFAFVQPVCISFPTSAHLLHFYANVRNVMHTHTQMSKHTHLSGDPRRSTVGPAPVCTLAWRCSHKSGHQHLSLSPGL